MSELALTLLRLGFLVALWAFVLAVIAVLRRDLRAPRDVVTTGLPPSSASTLPPPAPPRAREVRARRATPRTLVVTEGRLQGTVVPLGTAPVTIGRGTDNTLVIDDDYASTHHARLYPAEGQWVVEDLGSTNGTWLDRQRITAPTVLSPGIGLRVGRTVLELRK